MHHALTTLLFVLSVASPQGGHQIAGVVSDKEGEPIESALVVLQCECLRGTLERTTNARGIYVFRDLPNGVYTIQVLSGHANVSKTVELEG